MAIVDHPHLPGGRNAVPTYNAYVPADITCYNNSTFTQMFVATFNVDERIKWTRFAETEVPSR